MDSVNRWMRLDLRRIRSFRAVAEHGGFRAASEVLGISQPTLSAHIAELERELRVALLSRNTRRVCLTRMGERFLNRARRALDDLELAALEIRDEAAMQRGRVVLVCTPTLATHAISPFELLSLYVGVHGDLHPKRHLPRNQRAHLRRRRALDISA